MEGEVRRTSHTTPRSSSISLCLSKPRDPKAVRRRAFPCQQHSRTDGKFLPDSFARAFSVCLVHTTNVGCLALRLAFGFALALVLPFSCLEHTEHSAFLETQRTNALPHCCRHVKVVGRVLQQSLSVATSRCARNGASTIEYLVISSTGYQSSASFSRSVSAPMRTTPRASGIVVARWQHHHRRGLAGSQMLSSMMLLARSLVHAKSLLVPVAGLPRTLQMRLRIPLFLLEPFHVLVRIDNILGKTRVKVENLAWNWRSQFCKWAVLSSELFRFRVARSLWFLAACSVSFALEASV
ncbi:hypothetical protein F5Y01DRAFT_284887 [Xylaria sp. FL0043]|nr:hypothetical protein F5Y01DRAFT_284887 [Xylaria sp. FL0043]